MNLDFRSSSGMLMGCMYKVNESGIAHNNVDNHNEQRLAGKRNALFKKDVSSNEFKKRKRAEDQPGKNERQQPVIAAERNNEQEETKRRVETINTGFQYGCYDQTFTQGSFVIHELASEWTRRSTV